MNTTIPYSQTVLTDRSPVAATATLACLTDHVWVGDHAATSKTLTCDQSGANAAWSASQDCEKSMFAPQVNNLQLYLYLTYVIIFYCILLACPQPAASFGANNNEGGTVYDEVVLTNRSPISSVADVVCIVRSAIARFANCNKCYKYFYRLQVGYTFVDNPMDVYMPIYCQADGTWDVTRDCAGSKFLN